MWALLVRFLWAVRVRLRGCAASFASAFCRGGGIVQRYTALHHISSCIYPYIVFASAGGVSPLSLGAVSILELTHEAMLNRHVRSAAQMSSWEMLRRVGSGYCRRGRSRIGI